MIQLWKVETKMSKTIIQMPESCARNHEGVKTSLRQSVRGGARRSSPPGPKGREGCGCWDWEKVEDGEREYEAFQAERQHGQRP